MLPPTRRPSGSWPTAATTVSSMFSSIAVVLDSRWCRRIQLGREIRSAPLTLRTQKSPEPASMWAYSGTTAFKMQEPHSQQGRLSMSQAKVSRRPLSRLLTQPWTTSLSNSALVCRLQQFFALLFWGSTMCSNSMCISLRVETAHGRCLRDQTSPYVFSYKLLDVIVIVIVYFSIRKTQGFAYVVLINMV